MSPLPTISVVIPSHQRIPRLVPLVRTYVEQGADEVLIILDGPHPGWQDALTEIVSLPGVRIDELPANRGLALARTAGLERASGDLILIADDDVRPQPGLVERHREFHREHPGSALLGYMPVDLPDRRGRDQAATFIYARDYENQVGEWATATSTQLLESFWGGNASVPRALYERAEVFKPSQRLNYNEDLDLGMRLREIGVTCAFDIRAKGLHQHRRTFDEFRRECVVRGEAVFDLEGRWPRLPGQLESLVKIPSTHGGLASRLLRAVAARDDDGLVERLMRMAYRVAGALRAWPVQDAVARFMRRGLAMRGYRLAVARATP